MSNPSDISNKLAAAIALLKKATMPEPTVWLEEANRLGYVTVSQFRRNSNCLACHDNVSRRWRHKVEAGNMERIRVKDGKMMPWAYRVKE